MCARYPDSGCGKCDLAHIPELCNGDNEAGGDYRAVASDTRKAKLYVIPDRTRAGPGC